MNMKEHILMNLIPNTFKERAENIKSLPRYCPRVQGLIGVFPTFSAQDSISKLGELADVNLSLDPLTNVKVAKGPRYFKTTKAVGCICVSCLCSIVDPFPAQVTPAEAFLYFQHDLDHNPHNCHTLLCRLHHHGDVDLQEEEEGDCLSR